MQLNLTQKPGAVSRMAKQYAAAERARQLFENNHDDYIVVSGLVPITVVDVPGVGAWATPDPWAHHVSYYAGDDDSQADIDALAVKPAIELKPMSVKEWYPLYVAAIVKKLDEIERGVAPARRRRLS
ncbi:MAG: hypothetical protein Q7T73_09905 [Beijerinckiaceae bacterium]|nr:hypothetical protein [Beijerinckiaceae bacterium]